MAEENTLSSLNNEIKALEAASMSLKEKKSALAGQEQTVCGLCDKLRKQKMEYQTELLHLAGEHDRKTKSIADEHVMQKFRLEKQKEKIDLPYIEYSQQHNILLEKMKYMKQKWQERENQFISELATKREKIEQIKAKILEIRAQKGIYDNSHSIKIDSGFSFANKFRDHEMADIFDSIHLSNTFSREEIEKKEKQLAQIKKECSKLESLYKELRSNQKSDI